MIISLNHYESCPLRHALGCCSIAKTGKISEINGCCTPYDVETFDNKIGFPEGCPLLKGNVVVKMDVTVEARKKD